MRNDGNFLWGGFPVRYRHEVPQREDALTCFEDGLTSARIPSRGTWWRAAPSGCGADRRRCRRSSILTAPVSEPLCRVPDRGTDRPQELRRVGIAPDAVSALNTTGGFAHRTGPRSTYHRRVPTDPACRRFTSATGCPGIVNLIVLQHQIALAIWMQVNPGFLYRLDAKACCGR